MNDFVLRCLAIALVNRDENGRKRFRVVSRKKRLTVSLSATQSLEQVWDVASDATFWIAKPSARKQFKKERLWRSRLNVTEASLTSKTWVDGEGWLDTSGRPHGARTIVLHTKALKTTERVSFGQLRKHVDEVIRVLDGGKEYTPRYYEVERCGRRTNFAEMCENSFSVEDRRPKRHRYELGLVMPEYLFRKAIIGMRFHSAAFEGAVYRSCVKGATPLDCAHEHGIPGEVENVRSACKRIRRRATDLVLRAIEANSNDASESVPVFGYS